MLANMRMKKQLMEAKRHFERMRRARSESPFAKSACHGTIEAAISNGLENFDIFDLSGFEIDNDFELARAANIPPERVGRIWRDGSIDRVGSNPWQAKRIAFRQTEADRNFYCADNAGSKAPFSKSLDGRVVENLMARCLDCSDFRDRTGLRIEIQPKDPGAFHAI